MPFISIITPTLNAGESIEKTLRSVCRQSYKNIEHLIIDGASLDGTVNIVESFKAQYPHIRLSSERDSGVYNAMNKGLDQSKGDWIYFLGAGDEFYHDNILSELVEENFLAGEQVVYGNVHVVGDVGWAKDDHTYDGPFDLTKLLYRNICHQSIFYPASVKKKIGYYNPRYYITADWDYNMHCWAQYPFQYTDKIIAYFIAGGLSTKAGDKEFGDDKAENVIRYFGLDPWDPKFDKPGSPFYYLVSLYRADRPKP